jgi:hypothetical protein
MWRETVISVVITKTDLVSLLNNTYVECDDN